MQNKEFEMMSFYSFDKEQQQKPQSKPPKKKDIANEKLILN